MSMMMAPRLEKHLRALSIDVKREDLWWDRKEYFLQVNLIQLIIMGIMYYNNKHKYEMIRN